jgi:hypothetical protein
VTQSTIAGLREKCAERIAAFDAQGVHRTGTDIDRASAEWLAQEVSNCGLEARLEEWPIDRVDVVDARLILPGAALAGIPLFDGSFTGVDGIEAPLVPDGSGDGIFLVEHPSRLEDARKSGAAAVVFVTGDGAEIAPKNADDFASPWGLPVLQVAPESLKTLRSAIDARQTVRLIAHVDRTPAEAHNVLAEIPGTDPALRPLVVMTPRSGWAHCAAERGGGIAAWFATMEALAAARPRRTVHFVATSGHELGHLGLEDYIHRRLELPVEGHMWIHLGANLGAAAPRRMAVRSSTVGVAEGLAAELTRALAGSVDVYSNPPGPVMGEAANIADRGGRFVSLVGANDRFHRISDRWPDAVNIDDVAGIARVVAAYVAAIANG